MDIPRLKACIAEIETGGEPYPHGAVRIETLPDGTQTVSRGRFQITETTLRYLLPGVHASWLSHPVKVEEIMDRLLMKYRERYPKGTVKRIAYAHFAGPNAEPYRRKSKEQLAIKAAECHG